jgi:hypothetical protein
MKRKGSVNTDVQQKKSKLKNDDVCLDQSYQQNRYSNTTIQKFYLIKDAVLLSDKTGNLPIFSLDKANSKLKGAKVFYCSSYSQFWTYYNNLSEQERCFYETLLPNQLCHLYMDIEGICATNPNVKFEDLYKSLINELRMFLRLFLDSESQLNIGIIELDSSTSKKFSKHCIIKIQNCYFKNNYHCGALMRQFQKRMLEKHGMPTKGNPFYIWSEKETEFKDLSKKIFFVDLGVYTLRRQFRLLGSSKRCVPRRPLYLGTNKKLTKNDFFDCLIQYVPDTSSIHRVFHIKEPDGSEPFSCSLRTFDRLGNPISIASHQTPRQSMARNPQELITKFTNTTKSNGNGVNYNVATTSVKIILPWSLQQTLKEYFKRTYNYEITGYSLRDDRIKLETNDTRCMHKYKACGELNHKSNHVYFVVFAKTNFHFQGCYDDDTCQKGNKPCITLLGDEGHIRDKQVINALNDWYYPKDYSFKPI